MRTSGVPWNWIVTVIIAAMFVSMVFVAAVAPGVRAAASGSVSTDKTQYASGEIPITYESWSSVYFKGTEYGPNVWLYKDGVFWHSHTSVGGTGSHNSNWGSAPAAGSHEFKMAYATGWDNRYLGYKIAWTSATFTVTPSHTVSGVIRGQNYDQTTSYALPGATITARQESGGQYTGVVFSTTSSVNGAYSLRVAADWLYHLIITQQDHATNSYLHLGVYADTTQDFTLRCQWKEWPQPWELRGQAKDPNAARIFTRDVDGNGVVDSVNLFNDIYRYDWNFLPSRPANATFWVELQGYTYTGGFAGSDPSWVYPIVQKASSGCYFTSKKMVLHIGVDLKYGDALRTRDVPAKNIVVHGLELRQHPWSFAFCYCGERKLESSLAQFNAPRYAYYYGLSGAYSNWPPLKGDGTDLMHQMDTDGYPNTYAFYDYASASLGSWANNKDHAITFYGEFVMYVIGYDASTGYEQMYGYTSWAMQVFGFYLDYT